MRYCFKAPINGIRNYKTNHHVLQLCNLSS